MAELKPCPFCGGDGTLWSIDQCQSVYAVCQNCGMRTIDYKHAKEAIATWNRRVILDGCENELIVRCKDCKHYNTSSCSNGLGWCENIDKGTSDNFYCANGKQLNKESEES